jgi:hypothetical protein
MRRNRKTLIILAGMVVAAVLVVVLWPREKEPEYKGKKLSEWLKQYYQNSGIPTAKMDAQKFLEAQEAIRQIGTNGVPLLVKWIKYERPGWRGKLLSAMSGRRFLSGPAATRLVKGSREQRVWNAKMAFALLGEKGDSAVPELTRLANDPNAHDTSRAALLCLRYIGRAAIPSLSGVITNAALPANFRGEAILLFTRGTGDRTEGELLAVPALKCVLTDPDINVRERATNVLDWLAPEALTNGVSGGRK